VRSVESESPGAETGGVGERRQIAFVVLCLAALLNSLDSSLNVAFPLIVADFGIGIADIKWVIVSYIVAVAGLTIVFARLGDLFGHKRVFVAGIAASVPAFGLCAVAPSYEALIAARVFQGIATGLASSCVVALMTAMFPGKDKLQAVGLFVSVVGIGMAAGPALGGLLVDAFGWPAVFWYRSALALAVLLLIPLMPAADHIGPPKPHVDWIGAALLLLTIGCAVLLSVQIDGSPSIVPLGLVAALSLGVWWFVRHEAAHPSPILNVAHFSMAGFSLFQLGAVIINFCCFSVFLLVPFVLSQRSSLSFLVSGITLAAFPFGMIVSGALLRFLHIEVKPLLLSASGLFLAATALSLLGLLLDANLPFAILPPMILAGLGLGCFKAGCIDMTTALLPRSERGVAGSLYGITQVLGFLLGATFITSMLSAFQAAPWVGDPFAACFLAVGIFLLIFAGIFGALAVGTRRHAPPDPTARE
jgi:MFS family permease